MKLDFTNCKSVEDVNKVFAKNRKQLELVAGLPKKFMKQPEHKDKTAREVIMSMEPSLRRVVGGVSK